MEPQCPMVMVFVKIPLSFVGQEAIWSITSIPQVTQPIGTWSGSQCFTKLVVVKKKRAPPHPSLIWMLFNHVICSPSFIVVYFRISSSFLKNSKHSKLVFHLVTCHCCIDRHPPVFFLFFLILYVWSVNPLFRDVQKCLNLVKLSFCSPTYFLLGYHNVAIVKLGVPDKIIWSVHGLEELRDQRTQDSTLKHKTLPIPR